VAPEWAPHWRGAAPPRTHVTGRLCRPDDRGFQAAAPRATKPGADPPERPYINAMGAGNPILVG